MKDSAVIKNAGTLLILAAMLHLIRVLMGWRLVLNTWAIPSWASIFAVVIAGYLGIRLLRK